MTTFPPHIVRAVMEAMTAVAEPAGNPQSWRQSNSGTLPSDEVLHPRTRNEHWILRNAQGQIVGAIERTQTNLFTICTDRPGLHIDFISHAENSAPATLSFSDVATIEHVRSAVGTAERVSNILSRNTIILAGCLPEILAVVHGHRDGVHVDMSRYVHTIRNNDGKVINTLNVYSGAGTVRLGEDSRNCYWQSLTNTGHTRLFVPQDYFHRFQQGEQFDERDFSVRNADNQVGLIFAGARNKLIFNEPPLVHEGRISMVIEGNGQHRSAPIPLFGRFAGNGTGVGVMNWDIARDIDHAVIALARTELEARRAAAQEPPIPAPPLRTPVGSSTSSQNR